MPLVDLDDPAELRARWSVLAAVAHATGFDRRWYADSGGWYHQDETGSDLRMVRLDGSRAVLFGFHTQHSGTAGADLLAGSPEWIGQPEVKTRMAAGRLGFVYGSFNGTWARADYPGDPWQPLDDGFAPIAQWVTSDEDAARELIEWAAEWADYLGGLDELLPFGVAVIRTAASGGLTGDVLRDLFSRLGIGPRSPQDPDLRAALVAAMAFGDGIVAEGAVNAENLGRSGRMSAGYTPAAYAEPTSPPGYPERAGNAAPSEFAEPIGYAEPSEYAEPEQNAAPGGYAEPSGYAEPGRDTAGAEPMGFAPEFASETTGFVEPVEDGEEESFYVPPGVSPFTGLPIEDGDQMIGEPITPEPPITPFRAEPPLHSEPPFTPEPPPYQPDPEPEPRRDADTYGVTGKKHRRFGRKKKHEDGDALAVLGLVGPQPDEQDQYGPGQHDQVQPGAAPYEQAHPDQSQYEQPHPGQGNGQQPHPGQGQYEQGQPGHGLFGQGQPGQDQYGQGQPGQHDQGEPGRTPHGEQTRPASAPRQYTQPQYGHYQDDGDTQHSPEQYLGDRRLPATEPPRVGGPVEDGEDFYASLFADAPAAASYTPDVPTDVAPDWSADAPSPFTPLTNTPAPDADDTGVLPPIEDPPTAAHPSPFAEADQAPPAWSPESPTPQAAQNSPFAPPPPTEAAQTTPEWTSPEPDQPAQQDEHPSPFAPSVDQAPQPSPFAPAAPTEAAQTAPEWSPPQPDQPAQQDEHPSPFAPSVDQAPQPSPFAPAAPTEAAPPSPFASAGEVSGDDDAPTAEIEAVVDGDAAPADDAPEVEQLSGPVDAHGDDEEPRAVDGDADVQQLEGADSEVPASDVDPAVEDRGGDSEITAGLQAVDDDEDEDEYYPSDVSPFAQPNEQDDGYERGTPLLTDGFRSIDPADLQPGEHGYEFGGEIFPRRTHRRRRLDRRPTAGDPTPTTEPMKLPSPHRRRDPSPRTNPRHAHATRVRRSRRLPQLPTAGPKRPQPTPTHSQMPHRTS